MLRIGILVIGVVLGMNLSGQNTQFYVNENGDITHFDTLDFKDIPINTPGIIGTERKGEKGFVNFAEGSGWKNVDNDHHVDGYVRTLSSNPWVFPIGDNGRYRPVGITGGANTNAAYFAVDPSLARTSAVLGGDEPILPTTGPFPTTSRNSQLMEVSKNEYWDINGQVPTKITLTYDDISEVYDLTNANIYALTIVGWDGAQWVPIPSAIEKRSLDAESFTLALAESASTIVSGAISTDLAIIPNSYEVYSLGAVVNSLPNELDINTSRSSATYEVGETVQFVVSSNVGGVVDYEIFFDEKTPLLSSGTLTLQAGVPTSIQYVLNEPGVIFCKVTFNGQIKLAAATISPFSIAPLEAEALDFDAFWTTQKNTLATIPVDPQVTLLSTNATSSSYRVNLASIEGKRVYGFITIPNGDGPFPAMLTLPPFGNGASIVQKENIVAEDGGVIHMTISIHDYEPDVVATNAYQPNDINDRESIYNRYAILAGIRAIDYLHTRSDFDGNNVGLMGVSQGAGLATMVAGIDNRVNLLIASNPISTENLGIKYGKASGFPYYLSNNSTPQQEQNVKYFEAISFAKRYKGPVWYNLSYKDLVTPASGSFAAFNQFTGMKVLLHSANLGHNHPEEYWSGRYEFIRRFFPNAQPSNPFVNTDNGYFISAGPDQTISNRGVTILNGQLENDAIINPNYTVEWSIVEGPGQVTFSSVSDLNATASFTQEGNYILQLQATDNAQLLTDRQYVSLFDQVRITVGNCTDNDNDGLCEADDCDDNDPTLPAVAGSSCDDNDPTTFGDVIQADGCTCQGCPDMDADTICDANDCAPNDPNLPAAVGSICDDGDPNTSDDLIQADGCTCQGSTQVDEGPANCAIITLNGVGEQITVSNLNAASEMVQIVGAPTNWQAQTICDGNCPNTVTISNLAVGVYFVKINNFGNDGSYCYFDETVEVTAGPCTDIDQDGLCDFEDCDDLNASLPQTVGTTCDDGDSSTSGDVIQSDGCTCQGCPDMDADGICDVEDCAPNDTTLPAIIGSSCDDGNIETINDVIQSDGCTCQGTVTCLVDADNDGVCASDDCDDNDPTLPAVVGSSCDDNNSNTSGDVIQSDGCTCQGCPDMDGDDICDSEDCAPNDPTLPATVGATCADGNPNTSGDIIQADGCTCEGSSEGPANCAIITVDGTGEQITVSNLNASREMVQIIGAPTNWQIQTICDGDCPNTLVISNLAIGVYSVKINNFGTNNTYCYYDESVEVTAGPCTDEDEDGLCDFEDCDDLNANLPQTVGTTCDDGNPNTTGDVIQSDGCTCQGCSDVDGDLICDTDDCAPTNPDFPMPVGTACDDGDMETINDVIQSDGCTCLGIITCQIDVDNDGICQPDDCDDTNPNLPAAFGSSCNDNNPNTLGDVIQSDGCTCQGVIPSSEPTCGDVQISLSGNTMQIDGLTAPIEILKVFTQDYGQMLINCVNNCGDSQTIPNLTPQTYHVDWIFYTSNWQEICRDQIDITYSAFGNAASSRSNSSNRTGVTLFPNPVSQSLFINVPSESYTTEMRIEIYDILGKRIISTPLHNRNATNKIDLSAFHSGIYLVHLLKEGELYHSEKIMKQ